MRIALVGAHRATKLLAPYGDGDWHIWSCSPSNESELPRHNAWFELHKLDVVAKMGPVYGDWLRSLPLVYMQQQYPEIRGSHPYPIDSVIREFGRHFLTGTLSFMAALAIQHKPDVIGFWGVGTCPEYSHQLPSLWYFMQIARSRGIEIRADSGLLDPPPLYGWEHTER